MAVLSLLHGLPARTGLITYDGSNPGEGGVCLSLPLTGSVSVGSTTLTPVTPLECKITLTGKPVFIALINSVYDGTVNSVTYNPNTEADDEGYLGVFRGNDGTYDAATHTIVGKQAFSSSGTTNIVKYPVTSFSFLDTGLVKGVKTYRVFLMGSHATPSLTVQACRLLVMEL